jgi:UV DNA damage endonuclease
MKKINYGYACINETLKKQKITTNRSLKKATLDKKGLEYVSELSLQNVKDLELYLKWNLENDIMLFRLSSSIIPWANKVDWHNMKDIEEIKTILKRCGDFATKHEMRLTMHPGQFVVLTSPHKHVVENSISELKAHSDLMDYMGLSETPYNKINIHMGAAYGDKESAVKTFIKNFKTLPDAIKNRLTVENDDKAVMYSTTDLYDMVHSVIGIPIVFDYHHHKFCTGGQTEQEALTLATTTWGGIRPVVHYSESKALNENLKVRLQAHSDYIFNKIETYGLDIDVMIEAKQKELTVKNYKEKFGLF